MLEILLFFETLIGGLLSGVMYSLVALGFVLIFKASGVFNFAQGALVLFAALTFVLLLEVGGDFWTWTAALSFVLAAIAGGLFLLTRHTQIRRVSFVGPRPLLVEYLPLYSPEQARRHEVRPGITGWSQVNGRNAVDWDQRLAMDVWYVDNRSLWLDLRILVMTASKVARREGISQEGQATMEHFRGSDS